MCTWSEFNKLESRIKASVIGFNVKAMLLVKLQQGGTRAVPEVAREFKQIKKSRQNQECS